VVRREDEECVGEEDTSDGGAAASEGGAGEGREDEVEDAGGKRLVTGYRE
jgi:hypothetical protein